MKQERKEKETGERKEKEKKRQRKIWVSKFAFLLLQVTTDQANLCTGVGGISYHTTGSQYSGKDLGEETGQENCLPHIFFMTCLVCFLIQRKATYLAVTSPRWPGLFHIPHQSIYPQDTPTGRSVGGSSFIFSDSCPCQVEKITSTELNKILEI